VNRYRVLLPLLVQTADASYGQGDEFDHEFTDDEEAANLASGLLEIVPRTYRNVCVDTVVYGTDPGGTFDAAIPSGVERLLLGSHIERVDPEPDTRRRRTTQPIKE
jgi:hypothetical protein